MKNTVSDLCLTVIAVSPRTCDPQQVERFHAGISSVVQTAQQRISIEQPSVKLSLCCFSSDQISNRADIWSNCTVAILDVTECDEQLTYLLGRLQGAQVPIIAVHEAHREASLRRTGLYCPVAVTYKSGEDLSDASPLLAQELWRSIPLARIQRELIYQFWFPKDTSTIWVVCPQNNDPPEYASRSNSDFMYLDNFGDTDGLLETLVFLSQHYPNAMIAHFTCADLPEGHTSSNLVVLGGPGSTDIQNHVCSEMMAAMKSAVAYSSDCERMIVAANGTKTEFNAEYETGKDGNEERLRKDHGYFARIVNPLNENAAVVLINGIHTAGVLGAVRAFSQRTEALKNFNAVLSSGAAPKSFECHFDVSVINGIVKVPALNSQDVLGVGELLVAPTAASSRPSTRASIHVLFIAGDRGGSQVNQIQTPKEFHAIQDALRGGKHRDVMALANPILVPTRQRLANMYLERPSIVHFAGLGDDRSLSIIDDRDVIVQPTPLTLDQLAQILATTKDRVRLCVLNACHSKELAQLLVQKGAVEFAIGWTDKVADSAAIAFSEALYGALSEGRAISDAMKTAQVASGTENDAALFASTDSGSEVFISEVESS